MRLPVHAAVLNQQPVAAARGFAGAAVLAPSFTPVLGRSTAVTPQAIRPSVDWWCLLRKAGGLVAQCGTNLSCYAQHGADVLSCF